MLNIVNIQNNSYQPITFTSRKSNLRLGEKVLRDFKSEYPYLRSNTFVQAKIEQNKKNPKFGYIIENLDDLYWRYNEKIGKVRKSAGKLYASYTYADLNEHMKNLAPVLQKIKAGNCGEQSKMIQAGILNEKELAHNVMMQIQKKILWIFKKDKDGANHSFTIIGLKDGADINKPKTWGQEAVIIDAWTNTVMPAREASDYLKGFLGFGSKRYCAKFKFLDNIQSEDLA